MDVADLIWRGQNKTTETSQKLWQLDGAFLVVHRSELAFQPGKKTYRALLRGNDQIFWSEDENEFRKFVADLFTYDPSGMSPLERRVFVMAREGRLDENK